MAEVTRIVKKNIQKPRSIVPVVIGVEKDLKVHSILHHFEQIPGCRGRAFGGIAKSDLPRAQALDAYIELAGNKMPGYEFEWSWHILRNSTVEELNHNESWQQRDVLEEEFFKTSPWQQLIRSLLAYESPQQIVGIHALRQRVRQLLYNLNQKELLLVQRDIRNKLEAHESRLQDLRGERDPEPMRWRLRDGCNRLSRIVTDYTRGTLLLADTSDKDILVRSRIRELSNDFTWAVHNPGHTYAPEHFSPAASLEMGSVNDQRTRQAAGGYTPPVRPPKTLSQEQF